ncbi:MAG: helix-turn-helix transcriptional regulator [Clostridia bacterium]|nr:helix-turn-helix transcriptional regulator [Clostridia bacterium]
MKQIQFYGNKNIISEKVKARRIELNLSQADVAAKLQTMNVNIDQQMISKIEKNKRQVTDFEVACLCKCLNIQPNDLLSSIDF